MALKFFKRYFWLISIGLFIFLRLPSLFEPYWYGDEGIYLALGQGLRAGLNLYSQIHDNKPPILYYLAALGQTVFGFRLLLALVMVPTLYLFHRLASKFLSPLQAKAAFFLFLILSSIPLLEGNIANAEVFMLLPTILGVYLFLNPVNSVYFLYSGLLLGLALAIKIPVAVEIGALFLWQLLNLKNIKTFLVQMTIFAFGSLLPVSLFAVFYAFQGSLDNYLFAALLNNFGYLSSWSSGTHTSSPFAGGLLFRLLLLVIAWALLSYIKIKKVTKDRYTFLFIWFSATLFGTLLSGRPYPHYLIQLLPPLCLILVILFTKHVQTVKIISLSLVFVLIAALVKYKFYYYPVFSYYANYYSYLLGIKSVSQYTAFFGNRIDNNQQVSEFIKANSSPQDRIFVWGDEPYIYPLSGRLPSSRFIVAYHIVDFNMYSQTYEEIIINNPKYIVVYPMSGRNFPQLFDLIENYYSPTFTSEDIVVYRQR
jgi:4-amino-4-deoxy-L-arabinose transferase-like glycosyltransferase